ncbi:MAG: hypothetical protein PF569_00170 [Candidatus Woesearchaeota archaeon]|jgi:hypothetical protein|nr:hypothetical protein [Candidatus Woesearchaeota archaeon]
MKNYGVAYYTPEIEEFYIGFEFEYEIYDPEVMDGLGGNRYIKDIYNKDSFMYLDYELCELDLSRVRVKYLDKEEIESLGFVSILPEWSDPATFTFYKQSELEEFQNLKECKLKIIGITFIGTDFIDTLEIIRDGNVIFYGSVKNKSELKNKIMNKRELVDFGKYILSTKRELNIKNDTSGVPYSDSKDKIFDADIANFRVK